MNHGLDINNKNKNGSTPLHDACIMSNPRCMEVLINSGANVNEKNNFGRTALHFTSYGKHDNECLLILLNSGAHLNDILSKDKTDGETLFDYISERTKQLIQNGLKTMKFRSKNLVRIN